MTDPTATPSWGAPHRPRLRAVANLGAGQELDGLVVVPRSLFAPVLRCPDCLSDERNDSGDALDLRHVPGCTLAEELHDERAADLALLAELAERGWPQVIRRTTSGAEADSHAEQGVDAAGHPVVVQPAEGGGRRRWWPTLADDVS